MAAEDSKSKSFLSKYISSTKGKSSFDKSDKSDNSSVTSEELSTFGINPLRESDTHKKIRQMLDEATNAQTQIALED
tara:strand:- start:1705 stop:1935 length:231 start_codon:yes stop_codon:yes gene_type:complete